MTAYELTTRQFTGPLDKLLELIEERKLEITEISIAEVTDDFLAYIRTLEKVEPPFLADFIAIASKLIFIKSKYLLPDLRLTEEEEAEIKDLERRLQMYRELKPAMRTLGRLWKEGNQEFGRPYFLNVTFLDPKQSGGGIFYPGDGLSKENLRESLARILEGLEKFELETQTIKESIITIEEKIQEIVSRITEAGSARLSDLSKNKSVAEIVAFFLAILHLAREEAIHLEQEGVFSDIIIKHQDKKIAS